jgi:diacylglycerol kinase (ATP)
MAMEYVRARWRAVGYAGAGVGELVRTQANARIHLAVSAVVIGVGCALRVTPQDWCWLIAAMGAVWVAEALNTAVELLADAACPEQHPLVGRAKDVAAGAVLLAACGAVGIGVCVFGARLGW